MLRHFELLGKEAKVGVFAEFIQQLFHFLEKALSEPHLVHLLFQAFFVLTQNISSLFESKKYAEDYSIASYLTHFKKIVKEDGLSRIRGGLFQESERIAVRTLQ